MKELRGTQFQKKKKNAIYIKGELHHSINQKLTCLALYLKIISTFFKN